MFGLLFLAFLVVPILELYVFVQAADAIGFGATLFWIVAVSIIGAWLVRREGMGALRRANEKVTRGQMPTDELVNGILILFAGALMLTPGFLTDAVGLLLVFPPTRALLRGSVRRRFAAGPIVVGRSGSFGFGTTFPPGGTAAPGNRTHSGEVWDAESWEDPPDDPDRRGLG